MDEQRRTFSFQGKWELTYSVVPGSMVKTNGMNEAKETQAGYQEVLHITAIRGNGDRDTRQARRNQAEKILAIGNSTASGRRCVRVWAEKGAWGRTQPAEWQVLVRQGLLLKPPWVIGTKLAVSACYISE